MTVTFLFTDMVGNTPFHSTSLWLKIQPIFGRHFMTIFAPWCWNAHLRSGGSSHQEEGYQACQRLVLQDTHAFFLRRRDR